MNKLLTREQILGKELAFEEVYIPEWDGTIRIRELTGDDRDEIEQTVFKDPDKPNTASMRAKALSLCIVDENGKRLFTEEDVTELGKQSGKVIVKLYGVASKLSGLGEDEKEKMEKNSGNSEQSEGSSSD